MTKTLVITLDSAVNIELQQTSFAFQMKISIQLTFLLCDLNMWLITFPWKLYQICEHWYNSYLAIIGIHLHGNNTGFNKKFPFVAPPGAKMSHITEKVPWLAT